MKAIYGTLVIALLITTFTACKKHKDDDKVKNELVSEWELAQTSSMIPTQNYEPGNGNLLKINADGTYAYSKSGQVTEEGNYAIVEDNSVEENVCLVNLKDKYKHRFDISNVKGPYPVMPPNVKTFFYVADNKLYMVGGCFANDGGSLRVYRRTNAIAID